MINKQADAIADAMRQIFETAENNMVTQANIEFARMTPGNFRVTKLASLRNKLIKTADTARSLTDAVVSRASKLTSADLTHINEVNQKATPLLVGSALKYYQSGMSNILRLEHSNSLRDAIFKQTQLGINNGLKIAIRGGRKIGYKEYMEMNVRTTVQREIGSQQLAAGKQAGVVFYISNVYADCADDHKDYQGKIYYDERYDTFGYDKDTLAQIQNVIQRKNMIGIKRVREEAPYLTTRPNCRHKLVPISLEQAIGRTEDVISGLRLSSGTYNDKAYQNTQKQRYNERTIRFYKTRMDNNKLLAETSGDSQYLEQAARDRVLVSKWQKSQRELLDENHDLERDYRRETQKILLQDLGVRYGN